MPIALIVEDEPEANKLLAMLVRLRGYETESAFTGSEALAMIDHGPPHIVFLDLMLPDMNGFEVCKTLKTQKSTALIPVVMVTARVALENRIQCYSLGADQYVSKPYTPDQIFKAMEEADDWSRNVNRNASRGQFPLRSRDDGETLRNLARLKNLLLGGTTLNLDSVDRLSGALRQFGASADEWGRKHGMTEVATLEYEREDDRLKITLRDRSGWLRDDPQPPMERWPEAIALGRFDEIFYDPLVGLFTLVKAVNSF